MNQQNLILMGRATHNAEILTSKAGKKYAKFGFAVNSFNPKTETSEPTFYEVLGFNQQSITASDSIKKGEVLLILGNPEVEPYLSKEGEPKYKFICRARTITKFRAPITEDEDIES